MSKITDLHATCARRTLQWRKIRDALEGEDCVKDAATAYLPKPSAMNAAEYAAYKARASFYPVSERTVRGMSGIVFRVAPRLKLPTKLEAMRANLTVDGFAFDVLCEDILREVLSIGRYGMLLDLPEIAPVGTVPYVATYYAEDILNWEQQFIGGRKVLTRLILRDEIENQGGDDSELLLELKLEDGVYTTQRWLVPNNGEAQPLDAVVPLIAGKRVDLC